MSPDPVTGSATSRRTRLATWGNAIVVGVALVAVVSGVRTILALRGHTPVADYAGWQMQLADMPGRIPLTGPYSRLGWDHPGPLLAWLSFPVAALAAVTGLFVASLLINVAGLVVAVLASRRALGPLPGTLAAAIIALWAVLALDDLLVDPWNPRITVVAMFAAVMSLAALSAGGLGFAYPAIGFASLAAQCHVAALLPGGAVILATLWLMRARLRTPVLVVLVLWIGPLLDLVAGQHNLYHLARYMLTSDVPTNGASNALRSITAVFDPWHGASRGTLPLGGDGYVDTTVSMSGLVAVLLIVAAAAAVARRRPIGWMLLAGVLLAIVSLSAVELPVYAHVVAWVVMLVPLAAVVLMLAVVDLVRRFEGASTATTARVALAATLSILLVVVAVRGATPRRVTSLTADPIGLLAQTAMAATAGQAVVLADDDVPNTGLVVGLAAVMESRGGHPLLGGPWGADDKFGSQRTAHADDACRAQLVLVRRPAGTPLPAPAGERLLEVAMSDPPGQVAIDRLASGRCG